MLLNTGVYSFRLHAVLRLLIDPVSPETTIDLNGEHVAALAPYQRLLHALDPLRPEGSCGYWNEQALSGSLRKPAVQ